MISKKILRTVITLVVIALLIAIGTKLVKRKKAELSRAPKYGVSPIPVHVTTAEIGTLVQKHTYIAVVEPIQVANISARLTATVEKVLCDEGDHVKKGDVLFELDSKEIQNNIAASFFNLFNSFLRCILAFYIKLFCNLTSA